MVFKLLYPTLLPDQLIKLLEHLYILVSLIVAQKWIGELFCMSSVVCLVVNNVPKKKPDIVSPLQNRRLQTFWIRPESCLGWSIKSCLSYPISLHHTRYHFFMTVPGKPSITSADALNTTCIELTWAAVSSENGVITKYQVRA